MEILYEVELNQSVHSFGLPIEKKHLRLDLFFKSQESSTFTEIEKEVFDVFKQNSLPTLIVREYVNNKFVKCHLTKKLIKDTEDYESSQNFELLFTDKSIDLLRNSIFLDSKKFVTLLKCVFSDDEVSLIHKETRNDTYDFNFEIMKFELITEQFINSRRWFGIE